MERSRYYVSVQARTILMNQGDAGYELDIEATPDEVERLSALFDQAAELDRKSMIRAPLPAIPYHHDRENDEYDECLQNIYQTLYDLGTAQTKQHILSMGIIGQESVK